MKAEEILEGNRLVAEFDIFQFVDDDKEAYPDGYMYNKELGSIRIKDLGYNDSWDWLIPACKKFCELQGMPSGLVDTLNEYKQNIREAVAKFEIEIAFYDLINGIKWYNQNKG